MTTTAVDLLRAAQQATGSIVSIGLEPRLDALPTGFEPTIDGAERFLSQVIAGAANRCCAFKANLAFFESLGSAGWALLERVRELVPRDRLFIADAKRGDIGTTAEHYARAVFDHLDAHAATVNPLMGRDAVEPFRAHAHRLTYLLALTSNPGAADFLLAGGSEHDLEGSLAMRIAKAARHWDTSRNLGLVVGATRAQALEQMGTVADDLPLLVPGVGAQGADVGDVIRAVGGAMHQKAPVIIHVTRSVMPGADDAGDVAATVARKLDGLNTQIAAAAEGLPT
jgi:orotidine-5'-phosphate decarboxylase